MSHRDCRLIGRDSGVFEALEARSLFSAPYEFTGIGVRYDATPSLFFAQGVIDANDDISGTMQFATLAGGGSAPQPLDWTHYTRGTGAEVGGFSFGTRDGFTPYASQTGTRFIGEERRDLGSFVGRGSDGQVRDFATLMQPDGQIADLDAFGIVLVWGIEMQMTRLTESGELEVFSLRVMPTLTGGQGPATDLVFSYELASGTVTAIRHVTGFVDGVATLDGGERLIINASRDVLLTDFDSTDGIVGIASGFMNAGLSNPHTQNGVYRAAIVVTGPESAAFFGVDPGSLGADGTAIANVVIRLQRLSRSSTVNPFQLYRQDEYDAGVRNPVNSGTWQVNTVPPDREFGQPRYRLQLTGQDGSSAFAWYSTHGIGVGRSLHFSQVNTPTDGHEELSGAASGSSAIFGRSSTEYLAGTDAGRPLAYLDVRPNDARLTTSLYSVDLIDEAGGEAVVGDVVTWTSLNSLHFWAGLSAGGEVQVWSFVPDLGFTYLNLTQLLPDAAPIVGSLAFTTYATTERPPSVWEDQVLAGLDADGHFVVYKQLIGDFSFNDPLQTWSFTDTAILGLGDEGTLPAFVGDLVGWRSGWDATHFAGVDASGQLWAVWTAPGLTRWQVSDISASAGMDAANLVGNVSVVRTTWDTFHLNGTDEQGNVISTWWAPGFDRWLVEDLTDLLGGPTLTPGSITSNLSHGLETINIVGAGADGQALAYWWTSSTGWNIATLSADVSPSEIPLQPWRIVGASWFTSVGANVAHSQSLLGHDADGHLVRLHWRSHAEDRWELQDVFAVSLPYFL